MFVNIDELARLTGFSSYSLRKLAKAGKIPSIAIGNIDGGRIRFRFNPDAVQTALAQLAQEQAAQRVTAARSAY